MAVEKTNCFPSSEGVNQKLRFSDIKLTHVGTQCAAVKTQDFSRAVFSAHFPLCLLQHRYVDALLELKKEHKFLEVIILTGHGSIDSAVRSTKLGAYYYLQKPCELEILLQVLKEAYQKRIQKKHGYKDEEMEKIIYPMANESSLKILQHLKNFDTTR